MHAMQCLVSKTHPTQDESQNILSAVFAGSVPSEALQLRRFEPHATHVFAGVTFFVPRGQVVKHLPNGAKRNIAPEAGHPVQNVALSLHFGQLESQDAHFLVWISANFPSGQVLSQALLFKKNPSLHTVQVLLLVHCAQNIFLL